VAGRRRWARLAVAAALRIWVAALVGVTAACGTGANGVGGTSAGGASPSENTADGNTAVATARAASEPAGTITETGSGLLYPLAHTWAAAYHQQFPGVTVTTASTGSGKGIALASAGKVDIGASDAYLSSGDLVKNQTLLNIPLAISAQTVIYNLPGLGQHSHVELNGAVLAGIYDGTITMWNDPAIAGLNKSLHLPAIKIVPVHRSDSSGDTFLFTSYLSTQDQQWNDTIGYGTTAAWPRVPGAIAASGSLTTMHDCESTPGCVGYNGISYLSQALAGGLGEAALANSAGRFTLPTGGAIQDAVGSFVSITPPNETISMIDGPSVDGYPIVNYEYAVVSTRQPDAGKASRIRAFLKWVITTGNAASYLDAVGFQPLPAAVASLGEEQVAEIGS
jgi:phosphate transport system substrate-binding protein